MIKTKQPENSGFTLIELLLVISIISLLASIIVASTNVAKAKARDASKQITAGEVRNALATYSVGNSSGRYAPGNYLNTDNTYAPSGNGGAVAIENKSDPTSASNLAYERSMQDLVDAEVLPAIPASFDGESYGYRDYSLDVGFRAGATFLVTFELPQTSAAASNSSCIDDLTTYYPNATGAYITNLTCETHLDSCIPNSGDYVVVSDPSNLLAVVGGSTQGVHCMPGDYYGYRSCLPSYLFLDGVLDTIPVCAQ